MSLLLNFVNSNKRQLVQIYTKERQQLGEDGVLWIIQTPDQRVNVSYLTTKDLPETLVEEINKLKSENESDSIIYFYICDPLLAQIIQIDLRSFDPEKSQMNFVNKKPELDLQPLDETIQKEILEQLDDNE